MTTSMYPLINAQLIIQCSQWKIFILLLILLSICSRVLKQSLRKNESTSTVTFNDTMYIGLTVLSLFYFYVILWDYFNPAISAKKAFQASHADDSSRDGRLTKKSSRGDCSFSSRSLVISQPRDHYGKHKKRKNEKKKNKIEHESYNAIVLLHSH